MPRCKQTFWGYRRENGRVGVRNHVIILPVDDLSNAAAEAVANNIKGTLAIPHPYGRLQFGADLDLHFRTLIGTGSNPNVAAVVVIGIEDEWTKKVVDGIAATGKPVAGFGIELHGDHDTIMRASKAAREFLQGASEKHRVECALQRAVGIDQVRRVGHDVRLRRQSDRRRRVRQALRGRLHAGVRRDDRTDRRRADRRRALPRRQGARGIHAHVRPLPGSDQPPQDDRPVRLAADQGQHRRRPDDDRGKGARQHPEDRQEVRRRRRARQGRDADGPGPVVHGQLVGGGRDGHAVRGVGLRRPLLPDRAGQRHRQPDPAGHQDLRQSAHRAHDERARRRRHLGPAAARDHDEPRPATSCST